MRGLVNMGGEGLEEVVSGLAEPALQSIYNRKSVGENYRDLDMKELWQDGQVGMLLGVLGGNVNIAQTMNGNQRGELSRRGVLNEKFLSAPDRSTINGTKPITTYSDTLKAATRSTANSDAKSRGNISNLTDGTQNNSAGTIASEQNSSYADVLRKMVAEQNIPKVDTDTEIADTPEYDRYRELERKFLNGSIAEHEFDELRKLENVWGQFEVQKGLGKQESDWLIAMGRKTKAMLTGNKAVAFPALPDKMKVGFEERLSSADPDVETALRKICGSAKYKLGTDHRSYYTPAINKDGTFVDEDAITIGINAPPSTIAHELFHKLDRGGTISAELSDGLIQDYIALNVQSGGDIKGYLASNFPDAFTTSRKGSIVVNKDYSSIGDILNGLSGGQVAYGYGHQKSYWAQNGSLEAEAWAGFGRVYYDNNADVIRMFEEIFPNLNEKAKDKLKELI